MAESIEHRQLVERIVGYVSERFAHIPTLVILSDRPGASDELPPRIGGFVPDVYAADVPTTFTVVGEAKTEEDISSTRTQNQVFAFLRFLNSSPNSMFIFAVPWRASAGARDLLSSTTRKIAMNNVELVLLDGATGPIPSKVGKPC